VKQGSKGQWYQRFDRRRRRWCCWWSVAFMYIRSFVGRKNVCVTNDISMFRGIFIHACVPTCIHTKRAHIKHTCTSIDTHFLSLYALSHMYTRRHGDNWIRGVGFKALISTQRCLWSEGDLWNAARETIFQVDIFTHMFWRFFFDICITVSFVGEYW